MTDKQFRAVMARVRAEKVWSDPAASAQAKMAAVWEAKVATDQAS